MFKLKLQVQTFGKSQLLNENFSAAPRGAQKIIRLKTITFKSTIHRLEVNGKPNETNSSDIKT